MAPEMTLLSLVLTFVVARLGACLGAYLKKKGENVATREDIDGLVEQVSAVTRTTKAIEAQISHEVLGPPATMGAEKRDGVRIGP